MMHLMLRSQVQVDELGRGYRNLTGMMVHSLYGIDYLHRIQILLFMLHTKERVLTVHHTDYTVRVQEDVYLLLLFVRGWVVFFLFNFAITQGKQHLQYTF